MFPDRHGAERTIARSPATVPASAEQRDAEAGAYLADGVRLFRVARTFGSPPERTGAELEDCLTLEQRTYSPAELHEMGLYLVRAPTSRDDGAR